MVSCISKIPMPEFPMAKIGETVAAIQYGLVRTQDEIVKSLVRALPGQAK